MSLVTIFKEYGRFIKDNALRLLFGIILGLILLLGARYTLSELWMGNRAEDYQRLTTAYQQTPAEFQAIVSIKDGQLFTSANIFDELFVAPKVVSEVEKQTGIKYRSTLEAEKKLELYKSGAFRGGVAAIRDGASGIITFRILVGQNSEENLAIARAYADLISSGNLELNPDLSVKITREPESIELLNLEEVEVVPTPSTLGMFTGMTPKNILIFSVLGALVGFVLTFVLLVLHRLHQDKIAYGFEYAWDYTDDHILISNGQNNLHNVNKIIQVPLLERRFVIRQNITNNSLNEPFEKIENYYYLSDLQEAYQINEMPQELVFIIYSNATDKSWFKNQYQLAKLYKLPLRILHIV